MTGDESAWWWIVSSCTCTPPKCRSPPCAGRTPGGWAGCLPFCSVLLIATGVILLNNYTPVPQAYLDILELRSNVWFGELIRNIHHWSANLLIVVVVLHLIRVFATGAYRPPRELNWLIGVAMLLLVIGANFTGYLLPWDQLAFWAITVGTSILSYIPLIGESLSRLVLGGPEVGARAPCSTSTPCTSPSSRWGWSFWLPTTSGASAKMAA